MSTWIISSTSAASALSGVWRGFLIAAVSGVDTISLPENEMAASQRPTGEQLYEALSGYVLNKATTARTHMKGYPQAKPVRSLAADASNEYERLFTSLLENGSITIANDTGGMTVSYNQARTLLRHLRELTKAPRLSWREFWQAELGLNR
jgi:hypothetical protein